MSHVENLRGVDQDHVQYFLFESRDPAVYRNLDILSK